jgi:hypothetical protein
VIGQLTSSKTLKWAGGFIAVIVVWLFILVPLSMWRTSQLDGVVTARAELDRLTASIARLTAEASSLGGGNAENLRWTGQQVGQMTATIQSHLSLVAQQTGIQLRSVTPDVLEDSILGQAIGFRVEFESDLGKLVDLLSVIEFAAPVLIVKRATIRRLTPTEEQNELPSLYVQLDLVAPVDLTEEPS